MEVDIAMKLASSTSTKATNKRAGNSYNDSMNIDEYEHFHNSPVTITSPTCFVMKVEYAILDIMTNMIDLAKMYDRQHTTIVQPNIPEESNNEEEDNDIVNIEFLSSPHNHAFTNTTLAYTPDHNDNDDDTTGGLNDKGLRLTIDTSLLLHNDDIKDKIYAGLKKVYEIAIEKTDVELDQYVLRELRYLQEFLTHEYPDIATYIKVPLEEVITTVRSKTKGFNHNRKGSSPIPIDHTVAAAENGIKSPPLSPPAKKSKTDDDLYDNNNNNENMNKKHTKVSTSDKVKRAIKSNNGNDNKTRDLSDDSLYSEKNKSVQEPYGFFIDVGNEGDEGLFFD